MLDTHLNHERDNSLSHERREEHYLRDVRARVKLARAVVSKMPGLAAILRERPDRAARFYTRFGITEVMFRLGVQPSECSSEGDPIRDMLAIPSDLRAEAPSHGEATLPGDLHDKAGEVQIRSDGRNSH